MFHSQSIYCTVAYIMYSLIVILILTRIHQSPSVHHPTIPCRNRSSDSRVGVIAMQQASVRPNRPNKTINSVNRNNFPSPDNAPKSFMGRDPGKIIANASRNPSHQRQRPCKYERQEPVHNSSRAVAESTGIDTVTRRVSVS